MKFLFTLVSGNKKTGPIPVSMSSKETCPDACAFKLKGCYAAAGALNIHWTKLTKGAMGMPWDAFISKLRTLRRGTLWRHNQAGDLAGANDSIDAVKLRELTEANKGKHVICYTHKPVLDWQSKEAAANRAAIVEAGANGFNINLSANNLQHADELLALGIAPVASVVPITQMVNCKTPGGARVVICPAVTRDNVTCSACGLCARANREYVIGFPAHGNAKRFVNGVASAAA
jgi:hypothetical protein